MTTPTRVRAGYASAILGTPQAAKGTAATVFTDGASCALRATEPSAMIAPLLPNVATMDVNLGLNSDASYAHPIIVEGTLPVYATSQSLQLLLANNWGSYAAGTFTLLPSIQATQWLTLAWVEHAADTAYRVTMLRDAWCHEVALESELGAGPVTMRAKFAAIASTVPTIAASGLTLPAAPMTPVGQTIFPPQLTTVTRDPSGLNVTLRARRLALTFEQGNGRRWNQDSFEVDVFKRGKTIVKLDAWLDWSDEAWAVLDDMRANSGRTWRVDFVSEAGTTLRCTLYNFTADVDVIQRRSAEVGAFHLSGSAASDGTDFVTLTLT